MGKQDKDPLDDMDIDKQLNLDEQLAEFNKSLDAADKLRETDSDKLLDAAGNPISHMEALKILATVQPLSEMRIVSGFEHIADPRKREFLQAYSECGHIKKAAGIAGIGNTAHYAWMKDEEYAKDFAFAKTIAGDMLEAEAVRRASEGNERPVYQGGHLVGYIREYSDLLLIFLLKGIKPEKYREKYDVNVGGSLRIIVGGDDNLPEGI